MQAMMLRRWLLWGEWRAHVPQAAAVVAAIALGVALGFAVHLINAAAYNEFAAAARSLSGESDLQVRGVQATLDETLYPFLAQRDGVRIANPVLELDIIVPAHANERRHGMLKVVGLDIFRAAAIAPDLVGIPEEDNLFDLLADDAIFLSPAAMEWLGVRRGDPLPLRRGTQVVTLRVAGGLARARAGQRLGVMDIGALQWRFRQLGRLSRVELQLLPGVDRDAFKAALVRDLDERHLVTQVSDQEARVANMSRAYRVNLNMLALVALFTGAFLVFSTQMLSVVRRRHQLALLRVLGFTRAQLLWQIALEGAILGTAGALLGLALGHAAAAAALDLFGGDLGGGFFSGIQPQIRFDPAAAGVFFLLGAGIAMLGSMAPAWEAARTHPAPALKPGSEDHAYARLASPWPALACLAAGGLFTQLPPVSGLPVFGYLAVALLLIGGIALMPRLAASAFSGLLSLAARRPLRVIPALALSRLANAPNQAAVALGGVLASFTLVAAMGIMVSSFRISVDEWLRHILPADLYVQTAAAGDTRGLTPAEAEMIAAAPGILRADFFRSTQLALDPARPGVTLIARPIDAADPAATLPMTGTTLPPAALPRDAIPVWVSEAMVDLYGHTPGKRITLPIGDAPRDFVVAGVWRDYGRQFGAIQMRLSDYRSLTRDPLVNDAALWLRADATAEDAMASLQRLPFGGVLDISARSRIRALSLDIFDRSFAVTYLLEAVAVIIGLLGVAAGFSAQTLARIREFGVLRHIGMTRRQILALLAAESGLLTALGIVLGFVLGGCISLILVFIVNPQSFHWTLQWHLPGQELAAVALALLLSASLTALAAGRRALADNAVRAVREDW
ncbi:putative ABC transport system permease protein [Nitrosovibrio sp. Nv17]|nr:ABC transporter permease [Nitrosovibrio sp. Nv17]SFW30515.1 putative ABC transport system permease protein [Nitrosovibrio sp. Nv17]